MAELDVVVVSTEPPDPFGNAAGRWYYVLAKGLCERGHRVRWLAAFTCDESADRARACLDDRNLTLRFYPYPRLPWLKRKWQTFRRPYSYFIGDRLAQALEAELAKGYDVLHLEQTWAGWLGIGVPRALLSIHWLARVDLAGRVLGSARQLLFGAVMKWAERTIISEFDAIRVLTPRDGRIVRQLNPQAKIFTVPLAIDPCLYRFDAPTPLRPTVGFIGSMRWLPNYSAATRLLTRIWPEVKARIAEAQLLVVGWGARRSLSHFLDQRDVTILEDVPEAEPYFRQFSVLAYPVTSSSGMKVKILEAMAYGVPVVTTPEGIQGIDAEDERHASIAEDDETLTGRVAGLLTNEHARQEMRLAARRLVEERHSPEPILAQIEGLYREVGRNSRVPDA